MIHALVLPLHTTAARKTLLLHNNRIVLFIWVFNRLTSWHDPWGIIGIIINMTVLPMKYEMVLGIAPHISSASSLKRVDKNEGLKQKWIFCSYHKSLMKKQQPSDSGSKEAFSIILEFVRIVSDWWRWTFVRQKETGGDAVSVAAAEKLVYEKALVLNIQTCLIAQWFCTAVRRRWLPFHFASTNSVFKRQPSLTGTTS